MSCPNADTGQSQTVLLVEDNPGDARLVEEVCSDMGLKDKVHIVSSGSDALDFVMQSSKYTDSSQPDLIILDWHLPGMKGKEVLENLKNAPDYNHIPVIVTTGSLSEREVHEAYEKNANACIPKPTGPDELEETIRAIEDFWLSTARLPSTIDEES